VTASRPATRDLLYWFSAMVALVALVAVPAVGAQGAPTCDGSHWVGAWMAAPHDSTAAVAAVPAGGSADDPPGAVGDRHTFENQTFRMIVNPHLSGSAVRVQLTNRFGWAPITVDDIHVALRTSGASILPGSDHVLTFGGSTSVTIPAGYDVMSDPLGVSVLAFQDLAVSFHLEGAAPLDVHQMAEGRQYATAIGAGDFSGQQDGSAFTETLSSLLVVAGVEVQVSTADSALVALGDSLTDGVGSTFDGNQRWPDQLARRAATGRVVSPVSILNAGVSGNQVTKDNVASHGDGTQGAGLSAPNRVQADMLGRGVTDVVVFVGINDLFSPTSDDPVPAVIDGYRAIVERARSEGLRVFGATLTPAGQGGDLEARRQAINSWIRSPGTFDGVFDFDAAVRDPGDPSHIRPGYTDEVVHLNDAGYKALADSVDLGALRGTGCLA
jgi:lysophospholipase L1-like esterase